jgi:hypothetical protein
MSGDTESEMSTVDFARLFHFLCHGYPREMTGLLKGSGMRDSDSAML